LSIHPAEEGEEGEAIHDYVDSNNSNIERQKMTYLGANER
jgi:hypothetical protein